MRYLTHAFRTLFLIVAGSVLTGCGMPHDPNNTLDLVSGGIVRVGLIHNEPWVVRTGGGEPEGAEVTLVREFAEEINAHPHWVWGSESELMEALKRFELDLVIGGLTESSPWPKKGLAFTNPFFTDRILIGTPPEMASLESIDGVRIAVRLGEVTAAHLEKENAIAHRVQDP